LLRWAAGISIHLRSPVMTRLPAYWRDDLPLEQKKA